MLEAYLASLWNPADERAVPRPYEKNCTRSIIDDLQRKLDFANSGIAEYQRRAQILEEELQKRKRFIAPIRGVPDDVLLEVFKFALKCAPRQIWTFSHVCRHWHQLCRSFARLWSHLEVDLTEDRSDLVSKWRERAWRTNQTIDLQLYLEQIGSLKDVLGGGLKYITHLKLTILVPPTPTTTDPPKFDLPPALPCLRHLALHNEDFEYDFELQFYTTSLCNRLFTRKQTSVQAQLLVFVSISSVSPSTNPLAS